MTVETVNTGNFHNMLFYYKSALDSSAVGISGVTAVITQAKPLTASAWTFGWAGSVEANWVMADYLGTIGNTGQLHSVTIGGLGTNPFLT